MAGQQSTFGVVAVIMMIGVFILYRQEVKCKCAGGQTPGSPDAPAALSARELNLRERELNPHTHKAGSWFSGETGENCDTTCEDVGMVCTMQQLHAHNRDVNSSAKISAMALLAGSTTASSCRATHLSAKDVPNWSPGMCYVSGSARARSTFSCDTKPANFRHRLCYCHPPAGKTMIGCQYTTHAHTHTHTRTRALHT